MRIMIAAVGKLKPGAEADLARRYLDQAGAAGRRLGIDLTVREVAEGRGAYAAERKDREAAALGGLVAEGAMTLALDERGTSLTSPAFAARLQAWREAGVRDLAVLIGGPDGLADRLLAAADLRLALGPMTWPHQIVRALIAEQLYRAVTIISGHPYHRA